MAVIEAKLISRQNLKNGVKLVKLQHEQQVTGFVKKTGTFHIKTALSDEFELAWKVTDDVYDRRQWIWEEISLEKCDRNISFEIMIQADSKEHILKDVIKVSSLPFEHKLPSYKFNNLKVTFDIYYRDDKATPIIEPGVLEKYYKLLDNKKSSDVVFVFDEDQEITAHTLILSAQSVVFAAMFDSDMMEKNTGRVEIVDIEPNIFKQLLRFIYSEIIVSWDTDELLKLMVAANKYSVNDLVTICADRLSDKLSVDNAVEILIIADQVNDNGLKKECTSVIVENKQKIIDTPSFDKLKKFHKDLALQILDFFMGKETEVKLLR